jgi:hypothetical protein
LANLHISKMCSRECKDKQNTCKDIQRHAFFFGHYSPESRVLELWRNPFSKRNLLCQVSQMRLHAEESSPW